MDHFEGFPPETLVFLDDLAMNNNRSWFDENRDTYDNKVVAPARAFVTEFGAAMSQHRPHVVADPRIDGSIFRLHRDVRFSKDKSPYKTNLAFFFWEGGKKKKTSPGFYVHLAPTELIVGAGQYYFDKPELKKYREAVAGEAGDELAAIVDALAKSDISIRGEKLKRVPRDFDKDHRNGELLKHKGLFTSVIEGVPDEQIHSPRFVDEVVQALEPLLPLHDWLVRHTT